MGTIRADTIVASDGTSPVTLTKQIAPKLWATIDADAATAEAFDSFNVSSVSDDAAGKFGVTTTSAMSDANYYACGTCSNHDTTLDYDRYLSNNFTGGNMDARRTTTEAKVGSYNASYLDTYTVGITFIGDLA